MRSTLRPLLLLVFALALLLEGLLWARTVATRVHLYAYPRICMNEAGVVTYWEWRERGLLVQYDAQRRVVRRWPQTIRLWQDPGNPESGGWFRARLRLERHWSAARRLDTPRFLWGERSQPPHYQLLLESLNRLEARRRGATLTLRHQNGVWRGVSRMPVVWQWAEGRIVCRDTESDEILAGFGPDGYRGGAAGAAGARFGDVRLFLVDAPVEGKTPPRTFVFHENPDRLHFVEFGAREDEGSIPSDSRDVLEVRYSSRTLDARLEILRTGAGVGLVILGDELVLMDSAGEILARSPHVPGERIIRMGSFVRFEQFDGRLGVATVLPPLHPTGGRVRMRIFRHAQSTVVKDVEMEPVTAGENARVALLGALTLLRPLPLDALSFLSAPPETGKEMGAWWWRDPFLAGGRSAGWPLLSLVVALLCAWRARSQARKRRGTPGAVRFWTAAAFVLGPVGLVWMRLVVPRFPVVGGRAVDQETEPWPEPERVGTEVFG